MLLLYFELICKWEFSEFRNIQIAISMLLKNNACIFNIFLTYYFVCDQY